MVYLALTWSQMKYSNNGFLLSVLFIPGKVGKGNHNTPNCLHCTALQPSLASVVRCRGRDSSFLYSHFWPQFHSWFHLKTVDVPTISAHRKPLTKLILGSSAQSLTSLTELSPITTSHSGLGPPSRLLSLPLSCRNHRYSKCLPC